MKDLRAIPPEILAAMPPGPWRHEVHPHEPNVTRILPAASGTWVARVQHNGEQMPVVQEAIARVFAATPALLAQEQWRHCIESDDAEAARIGALIASGLGLRKRATDQRYATTWGTKTEAGLARTLLRILTE